MQRFELNVAAIVADPLCTISFPDTDLPEWYRCYGLGCGPNVQSSVEQMSREFLIQVVEEYPELLDTLYVSDVDRYVSTKEAQKNLHPRLRMWDQDLIIQAAQLDMVATTPSTRTTKCCGAQTSEISKISEVWLRKIILVEH